MKTSLGSILLAAGLLPGLLSGLRAQDAGESAPPPPGYVPLQYVPLYTPSTPFGVAPADPAADAAKAKASASDDDASDATPVPSFRAPTVVPRQDGSPTSGFAPVVSTPLAARDDRPLINESGGLPRVYAPGFRLGPFDVRPDLMVMGTYNDNIYLAPKDVPATTDYIVSITPRVRASYENGTIADPDATQFSLDYVPTILQFLDNPANSSLNQSLTVDLGHRFTRLRVYGAESYSHVSGGVIEGGDLVSQDIYNTDLDVSYDITPKTFVDLATTYNISRYTQGVGQNDLTSALFLNYQARPKLTLSIAPYLDYVTIQGSPDDQWEAGGTARVSYDYSERTNLYAQVGTGERVFAGSSYSTQSWNYQLGLNWQARAKTLLSLTSSRKTNGSALSLSSDYIDSNVGVSISQALVDHLSVSLTGSYDHAEYFSTLTGAAQQTYDYFSISPGISYHPTIWSDLGINYSYRRNFSNVTSSEFTNNQVNIYSTVRF